MQFVLKNCEILHFVRGLYVVGMPVVRTDGRSVGHVITKFSWMGRFIYPWCSAGALRARSSAIRRKMDECSLMDSSKDESGEVENRPTTNQHGARSTSAGFL